MKFILISIVVAILFTSCSTTRTSAIVPEVSPVLKQIAVKTEVEHLSGIEDPHGVLTLQDVLRLALLQNPKLAVYSLEIRAQEARSLQASMFPNPELSIETENFSGSGIYRGIDATETTISIGQLIELAGKRQKRTQIAVLESDLAAWDYEAAKLDIYLEAITRFTHVLALQEKVKLDNELLNIANRLLTTIEKRVHAGGLSPAETARARVSLSNAEITSKHTKHQLTAARNLLALMWNGKGVFEKVNGDLSANVKIPELEILIEKLAKNPEMARWAVEMEKRRESLALSEAVAVPDPTVSLAYRRINESKDNAFMAGVSIPLPIFNSNQGVIQEAKIRIKKGEWEKESIINNLMANLKSTYPLTQALLSEITILEEQNIPQAEKAFSIINDGYLRGKFQLIDVLDAQRTLFESRKRLVESLKNYKISISELERLTGENLGKL